MVRDIIQVENPVLRARSELIENTYNDLLCEIWKDLEDTLAKVMKSYYFRNSAGISAVQIGVLQRMCLIWTPGLGYRHIANPILISVSHSTNIEFEGCLSFFDKRGLVSRSDEVIISYLDSELRSCEERFTGWAARILCHELDHMDGILYSDRMRPTDGLISDKEYFRLRK